MSGGAPQQQAAVDNPYVTDLKNLKTQLASEVATLRELLKRTASDMGSNKVWVGKTATAWGTDIEGRRRRMVTLVDSLIPVIDAEIASSPAKVTPMEAKMYRMQ